MKASLPTELLRELRSTCPELIPVLVSLWSRGHVGIDAATATEGDLLWVSNYFPDVMLHENPELTLSRHPTTTLITAVRVDMRRADILSPAHVVYLPLGDPAFRAKVESALKLIGTSAPWIGTSVSIVHDIKTPPAAKPSPALFLDRDGTIIDLVPYITDPSLVNLKAGIVPLMDWARQHGLLIVCVTNQSGIGRAMYSWEQFDAVQARMCDLLAHHNLTIDATFAAGYFGESDFLEGHLAPGLRKPAPGMLKWAATELNIDLSRSIMIGDSPVDVEAGQRAGCKHIYRITDEFPLLEICRQLKLRFTREGGSDS